MVHLLRTSRFTEADLQQPEVQSFDCGQARWDLEVATWIKSASGANSALEDIKQFGTEVWLHWTEKGELVGFSSLGQNTWSIPMPRGPKSRINYIPFIGVHANFKGEPREAE